MNEMQIAVSGDIKLVRDVRRLVRMSDRWEVDFFNAHVTKNVTSWKTN